MEKEEIDLPRVEVDTNHCYEHPTAPQVDAKVVKSLRLIPGQRVVAFMPPDPEDEWIGVVHHDPDRPSDWEWWVELEV